MRIDVDMDRDGDLHQKAKSYADKRGLRMPRAYAELITQAIEMQEQFSDLDGDGEQ